MEGISGVGEAYNPHLAGREVATVDGDPEGGFQAHLLEGACNKGWGNIGDPFDIPGQFQLEDPGRFAADAFHLQSQKLIPFQWMNLRINLRGGSFRVGSAGPMLFFILALNS